ncbi:MAG: hypothetical protein WD965_07425 [Actinomycetota bacterium]
MYDHIASPPRPKPGSALRALLATLAGILLLLGGVAYAANLYFASELERGATRDARKLAIDVIQPLLSPADASAPIRGARYDQILASLEQNVLAGPINRVRLWRVDGTILFADDASLVGQREADMRDDIHAVTAGTSESQVLGDRFRTLTSVRVGEPSPILLAVELGRSHAALVEPASERWQPWVVRAGVGAGVCVALYVATAVFFGVFGAMKRRPKTAKVKSREADRGGRKAPKDGVPADGDLPPYMQAGFQDEFQSRKRAEDALAAAERQRDALIERVRVLELELEAARTKANGQESRPVLPTS